VNVNEVVFVSPEVYGGEQGEGQEIGVGENEERQRGGEVLPSAGGGEVFLGDFLGGAEVR